MSSINFCSLTEMNACKHLGENQECLCSGGVSSCEHATAFRPDLKEEQKTDIPKSHEQTIMQHWFCFSYRGKSIDNGTDCSASTYTGYPLKLVNMRMINENKKHAGVEDNAVLVSCTYLGNMTREDFLLNT